MCIRDRDTELEHVKAYTMLEEARFEKRLSIEINADPEALKCCVPNLSLIHICL